MWSISARSETRSASTSGGVGPGIEPDYNRSPAMNGTAPQSPLRVDVRLPDGAHAVRLPDDSHHQSASSAPRPACRAAAPWRSAPPTWPASPPCSAPSAPASALLGKAFGTFLANPWVIVPLALFFVAMGLSMFGAFEVALPMGLQQRLSRVGGRGFGGAFLMGLVGGHHRRALHGAAARLAAGLRRDHAQRPVGLRAARDLRRGRRPALLAAGRRSRCRCPKPGAWMECGQERLRHRAVRGRALLPEERRPGAGPASPRASRGFALAMAALVLAGIALGRRPPELPRRRLRARAQGAGRRADDAGALRRHATTS